MKDTIEVGRRYGDLIAIARLPNGRWKTLCTKNHEAHTTLPRDVRNGVCRRCAVRSKPLFYGETFGKLTVTEWLGRHTRCECECGNVTLVMTSNLREGHTKSCGCGRRGPRSSIERDERQTLYRVWANARQRTSNPSHPSWSGYGGRGIQNHLGDYATFRMWALANGYEQGLTLDRRDNDGNYEYGNLRWVPLIDQARNSRANVLNPRLVRKIRKLHSSGYGATAIWRMLGIDCSLSAVRNVTGGKTWRGIS